MPCSRGVLSQHSLQVVSQHALQQVSKGVPGLGGGVPGPRGVPAPGGSAPRWVPAPGRVETPPPESRRLLLRTVRILLECILVFNLLLFSAMFQQHLE